MKKTVAALVLSVAFSAGAQQAEFDSVVSQIMDSLTNVRTIERGFDAQIMSLAAENALSGPEVGFEYKFPQQRGAENRWGVEVSQSFDWPGIYGARRDAANELRALRERVSGNFYGLLRYEVEDRVMQVIEVGRRLAILEEVERNLAEISGKTAQMLELGQTTVIDCRKAEFELIAVREKIASARAERDRLVAMAGFGQVFPAGLTALTEFPERPSAMPRVSAEEIELETDAVREKANVRVESMKKLPSFSVGYVHDFEEGIHFNGFTVGMTLPSIGARKSATAARLEAEAAQMKLDEARAEREARLSAEAAEIERIAPLLAQYEQALGNGDYLRLLKKSFDARQITLTQYLLDQNWYLNATLDYLALRLRYHRLLPLARR